MKIPKNKIKETIMEVVDNLGYDREDFDPEISTNPECAQAKLDELIEWVELTLSHLKE